MSKNAKLNAKLEQHLDLVSNRKTKEQKDAENLARKQALYAYTPTDPDEIIFLDKKQKKEDRKEAYKRMRGKLLSPKATFDPATFDPYYEDTDEYEMKKRARVEPPRTLPTMGMRPKEVLEGQMIGMYESKQDLYLLIAWLSERVTLLEDKLTQHGIN